MPFKAESFASEKSAREKSWKSAPCTCAWEGCTAAGDYRAPKDRDLRSYVALCLEHVRAYNASWDYHKGATPADLETEIRSAATWERPTWKMGSLGGGRRRYKVHDPFGFAAGTSFDPDGEAASAKDTKRDETAQVHAARQSALKVLSLTMPVTLEGLKQRYKELVKKYHPDANGGSAEAETRMKIINQAYQLLRTELQPAVSA
ncbi:MAG: J domain-containing protein [Rhodospirillaceae bacterium]|nr:J domain-containing protein [Rhodospirillaceae bacterium]